MKHEAVELLSRYLKIDTTNPPGNEDRGVAFFAEILEKEGVAYKTYQPSPGRGSISAVIPGTDPDTVIDVIKEHLADDKIKVEIARVSRASESSMDTEDFAIIKSVHLEHFPNALAVASLLFGASDSRFFREKGIPCYGVCPMIINLEDLGKIHGIDERISEENMVKGTEVYIDMVRKLCKV